MPEKKLYALISTEKGDMKVELYADETPGTVANFVELSQHGFYDGLTFHRIIAGFMIQGGDPEGTGMGGAPEKIEGEFAANGVQNDLKHTRGVISNVSPAIRMALDLLSKQKELYKNNKISYFQPWLVLFTDGLPTDDVSVIKRELMQMQDDDKLSVYTMALSDDPELLNALRGFSKKQPIRCADPKDIQRFFEFLAKSVSVVAAGGEPQDIF